MIENALFIIGAGRSGTTLLNEMLDAHPDIRMLGESEFMISRVWQIVWEGMAARGHRSRRLNLLFEPLVPLLDRDPEIVADFSRRSEAREVERAAALVRNFLMFAFDFDLSGSRWWGLKETWMGLAQTCDWSAHDRIFPSAHWLHIVRHPYHFARSLSDWSRRPLTHESFLEGLRQWTLSFQSNDRGCRTGCYRLIRYEDLVECPRDTLSPVLGDLGLGWAEVMLAPLRRKHVPSLVHSPLPILTDDDLERVPNLVATMERLGYDTDFPEVVAESTPLLGVVTNIGDGVWRLNPPFGHDEGYSWICRLGRTGETAFLGHQADTLSDLTRSRVVLFENERPLAPAHAFHQHIRVRGAGAYSHWDGNVLLFSTSDGSDPNENGRSYIIRTVERAG